MRTFLILYVIFFVTLNFYVSSSLFVLLLAMSTFPVTVYLLLTEPKPKLRKTNSQDQQEKAEETVIESTRSK